MMIGRVLLCLLLFTLPAIAHEWYDSDCCSDSDCHPIACDELIEKNKSMWFHKFEFFGQSVRPSKDSDCHVCISNEYSKTYSPVPRCVYIQNGA